MVLLCLPPGLRQLPPVTVNGLRSSNSKHRMRKQNNDGHTYIYVTVLMYAGGTLQCVLYLSLEILSPLFTGVRMLCIRT
jgi:hypothetical protein